MTNVIVLDSYALLAYVEEEEGAGAVQDVLGGADTGTQRVLMTAVNLGEVLYILLRTKEDRVARETLAAVEQLPIEIIAADRDISLAAAELKAAHPVAYADCFAAALALKNAGSVLTGDPEFKRFEPAVTVSWL